MLTGLTSLPPDRDYWTLCNKQDPSKEGTEIVQLCKKGFLTKNQFHGVDWDEKDEGIIKQNKIWHPEANWYRGEWMKVIRKHDFNPALVYLDTTCFVDRKIIRHTVGQTMPLCPPNTVLLVNVMLNDPRSSTVLNPRKLVESIRGVAGYFELKKWSREVKNFRYSGTGLTHMKTFAFYKMDKK